jgi:hypothetical protein
LSNFVQQLPALVGVVLGALTTYLVTSANERSKWRKEQYIRWGERRITAYADIADSLKKVAWGFLRVAASDGLNVRVESFQDEADQAQFLREVEIERSAKGGSSRVARRQSSNFDCAAILHYHL